MLFQLKVYNKKLKMDKINSNDCNLAIQALNFDIIQQYFEVLSNYYSYRDKPVYYISLGSGYAQLEFKFKDIINWICIDPNPTSYKCNPNISEPYIQPQYKSVKDCIEFNNTLVNNCVLLLNWMPPTTKSTEDKEQFEKEAIELLQPLSILSLFEKFENNNGSAGGYYFHSIFDEALNIKQRLDYSTKICKSNFNNKDKIKDKIVKWKKVESNYNYRIASVTSTKHKGNKFRCDTIYIAWLKQTTEPEISFSFNNKIPNTINCNFYNDKDITDQINNDLNNNINNECIIC
jgi:hypothetical protein